LKFYTHHRQDLLQAFTDNGLDKSQFSFIKRRGRIITQHNNSKSTFSYLARNETTVDENSKEWIEITSYEIKKGKESTQRIENWQTVLQHFDQWLKEL